MEKQKTIRGLIKKSKVGKYVISLISEKEGYWYYKLVQVKKANKILFTSERKTSGGFYKVEDEFKNIVEEYKKKAISEGDYKFTYKDFIIKPKTSNGYIMQKVNKYTGEVVDKDYKISTFEGLIRCFIHNKTDKKSVVGNYRVEGDKLIYVDFSNKEKRDILVLKLKNKSILGNASRLNYCGRTRRGDESPAQRVMFEMNIPLVPFNVFEEAKLNIQNCKILEQGKEEDFILPKLEWNETEAILKPVNIFFHGYEKSKPKIKKYMKVISKIEKGKNYKWKGEKKKYFTTWSFKYIDKRNLTKRHFVGAMLLRVKNRFFLFDVDRNELKHYRFNPFLVELPKPCKTIEQAYNMLKPLEVEQAEKKGLKILRQGEWFFIPTKKKIDEGGKPTPKKILEGLANIPKPSKYDLGYYNVSEGRLVSKRDIKYICKEVNLKYRNHLKQRINNYNNEVEKYLKFKKQEEDFKSRFNFFNWGGELQAGDNRPNRVDKLFIEDGVNYVTGTVTHTGREHEPITLKGWYKAIPNTAIKSFTITGNID